MEEIKKIRLKQEGGAYTTYGIQDERAREGIATLVERVDELDGNVTVNVNPASGTFYRYGEPCTDNWCEKFVAGGNVAVRVETTDAARKFNLREKPVDGIYISSGQMQGWRIVAPDGYRIKGYRLSAVLRTEGQATITASTGQEIVVTQEHGASLAVTGLNAQETTFMTTDSSATWGDRQIWILTFEIYVERTDRFALKSELDGKQDIIDDLANIRSGAQAGSTAIQPDDEDYTELHGKVKDLDDTAVRTGSYDATVAVGLADNLRGDTIVNAEFYKRKTGGIQSVGSGIAAIKEIRGKSIVWNQKLNLTSYRKSATTTFSLNNNICEIETTEAGDWNFYRIFDRNVVPQGHKLISIARIKSFEEDFVFMYTLLSGDIKTVAVTKNAWSMVSAIITSNGVEKYNRYALGNVAHFYLQDMFFDLTLMFGAGNEPSTPEEFEKMFPLDYYDYNAGEIIPFAGQNLVTIGKNQYNPATGKANLLGGQTYQLLGTYTSATIDEVAVTLDSNNCFTTTKDCVLEITGGNDTDTFVGLYNGETNTYEPYERHTLPLDPSQWRDKDGNLVFPYGGMHGVGAAYDYAKVDADGYIRKAVRVFERRAYESGDTELANVITDGSTYTFYPLETPVEVELATPIYAKYLVDKDGTEEITPANGTTPYTAPANLSILYAMDATGEIKNLPKNYLSKESAENMLNAMKSAGVISNYTMTYSNGQYVFTFVKAQQASTNTVNNESNI